MSGICAVWQKDGRGMAGGALAAMVGGFPGDGTARIHQHTDGAAAVGLSARFESQHFYEDAQAIVCCDADLNNESALAQLTDARGTTAALMAALYGRFGCDFIAKLRGAFSLLIWDRDRGKLIAAVDHFGVKRLAYTDTGSRLLIGSRIDALMRSGEVVRDINPHAIANVLNFSVSTGPGTAFKAVRRLPPGSMLIASQGAVHVLQYWDMRYGAADSRDVSKLAREMESVVEASVAANCKQESFDKVGAFLSGGTDSSTVVGMMSRLGRGAVNAFSIGFDEESFNELEYARIAAGKFGARHHTYFVSAADCADALPHMVRSFDEPFGNSSAIPTYFCARLAASKGIKTLLGGDGGDELFGGNEAYRTDHIFQLYHRLPGVLRKGVIEPALRVMPFENGFVRKARNYVRRSNMSAVERNLSYHFFSVYPLHEVFESDYLSALHSYSVTEAVDQYHSKAPATDPLDRRLYADVKTVLADSDLPKVTCMADLAGVQARFPFLDVAVAEFSGRIPADFKVNRLEKRYLFKRAFKNLLPPEILAKRKHGFGIPVAIWMKSDRRMREITHDILLSRRAFERGYFRREFIDDLFRKHQSDTTSYYGDILWVFLALELWHREFVDAPATVAA
jgi:asparagine synthase (glutamine-hydrolysing)